MRKLLSWIGNGLFSSSLGSNYVTIFIATFAGIILCVSFYLYQSLQIATLEKEQALAQITMLEKTVARLHKAKEADNNAAYSIIHKSDVWNELNTKAALEIAELPKIEWSSNKPFPTENNSVKDSIGNYASESEKNLKKNKSTLKNKSAKKYSTTQEHGDLRNKQSKKERETLRPLLTISTQEQTSNSYRSDRNNDSRSYTSNGYSQQEKEASYTPKKIRLSNHFAEQERQYNETTLCSIDTPLPRLSAPLIMLYEEVSRSYHTTASFLADGNNTPTRSSSQNDECPSVGTVDKRTSHDLR